MLRFQIDWRIIKPTRGHAISIDDKINHTPTTDVTNEMMNCDPSVSLTRESVAFGHLKGQGRILVKPEFFKVVFGNCSS